MSIIQRIKNKVKRVLLPQKPIALSKQRIKQLVGTSSPIIMEIGSANGDDSLEFLQSFDAGMKLYGFEPEPKNITLLKERVLSSRRNFSLYEGVMSDIDGELTFNRSRSENSNDLSFSGSIMKPKNHLKLWDWIYFDETMTVPSVTLDTFCANNNIDVVDFIWCDSQGAEERIILGGKEAFEKKVRYFYTEYCNDEQYENQPRLNRILALLPSFEIVEDFGKDILLKNKNV